jgi:hypothetical protein
MGVANNRDMDEPTKTKRGWELDSDVVAAFDDWTQTSGVQKTTGAQLGLWLVTHLDASSRQACLDAMNDRAHRVPGLLAGDARLVETFQGMCREFGYDPRALIEAILHWYIEQTAVPHDFETSALAALSRWRRDNREATADGQSAAVDQAIDRAVEQLRRPDSTSAGTQQEPPQNEAGRSAG